MSHHIASQAHKAFVSPRARQEMPTVTQNSLCGSAAYCCTSIVRILPHLGPARTALPLADDTEAASSDLQQQLVEQPARSAPNVVLSWMSAAYCSWSGQCMGEVLGSRRACGAGPRVSRIATGAARSSLIIILLRRPHILLIHGMKSNTHESKHNKIIPYVLICGARAVDMST